MFGECAKAWKRSGWLLPTNSRQRAPPSCLLEMSASSAGACRASAGTSARPVEAKKQLHSFEASFSEITFAAGEPSGVLGCSSKYSYGVQHRAWLQAMTAALSTRFGFVFLCGKKLGNGKMTLLPDRVMLVSHAHRPGHCLPVETPPPPIIKNKISQSSFTLYFTSLIKAKLLFYTLTVIQKKHPLISQTLL